MEKKNTDTAQIFRYVTFALFAYLAVTTFFSDVEFLISRISTGHHLSPIVVVGYIVGIAASVLIPVGILCKKKKVTMVGCILFAVGVVLKGFWGSNWLLVPAFILAAVACNLEPQKAVMLTAGSAALLLMLILSNYFVFGYGYSIVSLERMIVRAAATFLLAFAFEGLPAGTKSKSASATSDKIEHLTRLKDLLDKGILTQEEFDEKKKQILDT